jgi:hypothetical protein
MLREPNNRHKIDPNSMQDHSDQGHSEIRRTTRNQGSEIIASKPPATMGSLHPLSDSQANGLVGSSFSSGISRSCRPSSVENASAAKRVSALDVVARVKKRTFVEQHLLAINGRLFVLTFQKFKEER